MQDLSLVSRIVHLILVGIMGLFAVILAAWQIKVLKGKPMKNPDGTTDDWHEQKTHYGIAFADVVVAVPTTFIGIALVFVNLAWGVYVLSMISFWFVWANTMTTATSLRFEKPKMTAAWFVTFPLGILIGLAYLAWATANFEKIF